VLTVGRAEIAKGKKNRGNASFHQMHTRSEFNTDYTAIHKILNERAVPLSARICSPAIQRKDAQRPFSANQNSRHGMMHFSVWGERRQNAKPVPSHREICLYCRLRAANAGSFKSAATFCSASSLRVFSGDCHSSSEKSLLAYVRVT
jgi:hypothetical protein